MNTKDNEEGIRVIPAASVLISNPGKFKEGSYLFYPDKEYYTNYSFSNPLKLALGEQGWLVAVTIFDKDPCYTLKEIKI